MSLSLPTIATTTKISLGAGTVNAPIAGRDNIIFGGSPRESKPPHVHPRLRIDSLSDCGWIRIRFELTNGDVAVRNIRKTYKSLTHSSVEFLPVAGSMAPGAENIGAYYEHISRTKTDDDLVILTLYFDPQIGPEVKHFISEHRFPICKEDLVVGKRNKAR